MDFNEISLAVLFLLQEVRIPLNAEQISLAFDCEGDATFNYTYIDVALALNSLCEKELISKKAEQNGEFYSLALNGRLILSHLKTNIRNSLRKHLSLYAAEHFSQLRLASKVDATISPFNDGTYQVILRSFDKNSQSTDIFIVTESLEEAEKMVYNWKNNAHGALSALYTALMMD